MVPHVASALQKSFFGLSSSRLNRRYRDISSGIDNAQYQHATAGLSPEDMEMESISQRGGRRRRRRRDDFDDDEEDEEDDLGDVLSKTPINERYFSQPDLQLGKNGLGKKEGAVSRSQGNVHRMDGADGDKADDDDSKPAKSRLHGHPRYVKGQGRNKRGEKSSALSDTSEAPSLASHVRRVRVPSQASDVDQFLDDLFMPVLDDAGVAGAATGGNVDDGLSDARSLAASMRGGGNADDVEIESFSRQGSAKRRSILRQGLDDYGAVEDVAATSVLGRIDSLLNSLKGGKDSPADDDRKRSSGQAMGFQPIPGMVSPTTPMMSPPPMLMPTPIHSMIGPGGGASNPQSLMMMQQQQQSGAASMDGAQAAMAFTYVPVPVYNMGGASMPGMQGIMPGPGMMGEAVPSIPDPRTSSPTKSAGKGGGGEDEQQQVQQQMVYQQAFLQNAVAQNMQIQQQLMMQNQALTQLLQTPSPSASTPMASMAMSPPSLFNMQQSASMKPAAGSSPSSAEQSMQQHRRQPAEMYFGESAHRRASADNLLDSSVATPLATASAHDRQLDAMKQRSLSTPNTPKTSTSHGPEQAPTMPMDPYTRAGTIRIGKWRWPPPKDETMGDEEAEGFFQFKMRKMQERKFSREEAEQAARADDAKEMDEFEFDGENIHYMHSSSCDNIF